MGTAQRIAEKVSRRERAIIHNNITTTGPRLTPPPIVQGVWPSPQWLLHLCLLPRASHHNRRRALERFLSVSIKAVALVVAAGGVVTPAAMNIVTEIRKGGVVTSPTGKGEGLEIST